MNLFLKTLERLKVMYKGLIIVNFNYGTASDAIQHKIDKLKEEFLLLDTELEILKNDGSLALINDSGYIELNIPKCDFVIYLDKDKYLLNLLIKEDILIFNRPDFITLCDDKMLTHIKLANHNINMPKTIAGPLYYNLKNNNSEEVINNIINQLSFPIIVKGVHGSMGLNMMYASNKDELLDAYEQMKLEPLLFQEYITSSYGKSIRVMVVDHQILGAILRYHDNDFRSNYKGSKSEEFILNDEYKQFILKIVNILDIDYAGIDLLIGQNNEPILCEINQNAFFKEFLEITNINVAKIYAKMVIRKVKDVIK